MAGQEFAFGIDKVFVVHVCRFLLRSVFLPLGTGPLQSPLFWPVSVQAYRLISQSFTFYPFLFFPHPCIPALGLCAMLSVLCILFHVFMRLQMARAILVIALAGAAVPELHQWIVSLGHSADRASVHRAVLACAFLQFCREGSFSPDR